MPGKRSSTDLDLKGRRDPSELDIRINFYKEFGAPKQDWYSWVFDQFQVERDDVVLELGCGSGEIWEESIGQDLPANSILLSDLERGMVIEAQNNLQNHDFNFDYFCGDASEIPLPDDHFDKVIANHLLHLVEDVDAVLNEIIRVLKPKGRLFATTKSENSLNGLNQILKYYMRVDMNPMGNFSLEDGEEILSDYFNTVTRKSYKERLQVDEVPPLLSFISSKSEIGEEERARLNHHFSVELNESSFNEEGKVLLFEKDMCIFMADSPDK